MKTELSLLCELLECGYLDIKFLVDLIDNNNIENYDYDLQEIILIYWYNINWIIYNVLQIIANKFIWEHENEIKKILGLLDSHNLEEYQSENELYEIYTNYMDSHLWFINDDIQDMFWNSDYRF